jgi:AcrR family transcriptional regulator
MAIKYKTNCRVCQMSRGNPKLRSRISIAYFKRDEADESVTGIAEEIGVNTRGMYNHCKKHIKETTDRMPAVIEGNIERLKAKIAKETELAIDHDAVTPSQDYERALTDVIAEGMAELRRGGKTVTVSQLITAAKIKGDFQAKKRGQDIEVIKSMYKFSSGYSKNIEEKKEAENALQG